MSWRDLIEDADYERILPWYGHRKVHSPSRSWTLQGPLPPEHGWYAFDTTGGRFATLVSGEPMDADPAYDEVQDVFWGYLVGDRIIIDGSRVVPDPKDLIGQTERVYCVELGLERFTRARVTRDRGGYLVYMQQEFPLGPESDALAAYQDRKPDLSEVSRVTPGLDLAFRWISYQRELAEERARELERIRAEEEAQRAAQERLEAATRDAGTAVGRRVLAAQDFEAAAREALRVSGAELLDVRHSHRRAEMVVQYRFRHQRLECVIDRTTLRVIDAGVCLQDHETGEKGDTWLTLESLPGVIGEALDLDKLVIWRHV